MKCECVLNPSIKAEPSVWLTAWVVRIFTDVSFQDWEDFIYIDPKVR